MRHPSTPTDRGPWVGTLLAQEGRYGAIAAVRRASGATRPTLVAWRETARAAVVAAFTPPPSPGPAASSLARAVLTLLFEGHASYRGVQACLHELLGWPVSLGRIAKLVRQAGDRALAWLAAQVPATPVALALDECFGGDHRRAYLSAVAVPSGQVWAATGPAAPDAAQWQAVLTGLAARGLAWQSVVHDGGAAAAVASAAVRPTAVRVRDVWHVLARCGEAQARLTRAVTAAWERWLTVAAYDEAVAAGHRPQGRVPTTTAAAQAERVRAAEDRAAAVAYLTGELRDLPAVVVPHRDRLLGLGERRGELEMVLALLGEVAAAAPAPQQAELTALQAHLTQALDGLLAWVPALEAIQGPVSAELGDAPSALVGWGWRHRAELGWTDAELLGALPESWRPAAQRLVTAWNSVARASSVVEGWHATVRPHLALRRRLSDRFLAVLAVRHNHRVARAGRHAGTSPLHRAGIADAPADWLTALGYPPPSTPSPRPVPIPQELPMAA